MNIKEKDDKFTAAWMDRCHELELKLIEVKNKLEAKPKVTREFVEKWAEKAYLGKLDTPGIQQMLTEAGVEVEK